jgi:hypothetical protein
MVILLAVVAQAVVHGWVGEVEFDVVDQFAAFGRGQRRRGQLPAAARPDLPESPMQCW